MPDTYRSTSVPGLPGLAAYMDAISAGFCPYLGPSLDRATTWNSVYTLDCTTIEEVEQMLFYLGVLHTEILRRSWKDAALSNRPFICENLFLRFLGEDDCDGGALFSWPHWILKTHYTQTGILFGKFWKGEEAQSRDDRPVPPPPYHMLSIRRTVKPRDPHFFLKAPELLPELADSVDDGRCVWPEVTNAAFLAAIANPATTGDEMIAQARSLMATGVYEGLVREAREKIQAQRPTH